MDRKGFTLVEVILSIAIIGLIAVSFLPMLTFSYTNLIGSEKFTQNMFNDQQLVEKEIDSLRDSAPANPNINFKTVFGVDVPMHKISINTSSSGQVKVYLPKQTLTPRVPIIKDSPTMRVRHNSNNFNVSPQPDIMHIFNDDYNLFVSEVPITNDTKADFLMNVYRWYSTDEISENNPASNSIDNYVVIKEWNEAKTTISYAQAISNGFTPNIKEYTYPLTGEKEQYNILNYRTLEKAYNYNKEDMINVYGNRYVRYGVTPYSLAGRIGEEKLSNVLYVEAPRIEILASRFHPTDNSVVIMFNHEIEDYFSPSSFFLNEVLGSIKEIRRDEVDHRKLVIEFINTLDKTQNIAGNILSRGAIATKDYGAITIWFDGYPSGEFTITP